MNRRDFARALAMGTMLPAVGHVRAATAHPVGSPLEVAVLVHPDMVLLDLVGPQTVFSLLMAKVHLVSKDLKPVTSDVGLPVPPTTTFADAPQRPDVLFVPGGLKGSVALMEDREPLIGAARDAALRAKTRLGV